MKRSRRCCPTQHSSFRCERLARHLCGSVAFLLLIVIALQFPAAIRAAARHHSLGQRINAVLRGSTARLGFWGIEVVSLPGGKVLYARNARHLFQPASNMKLFTTSAALSTLGPNFIFRTTVESTEPPNAKGVVPNLYLVGRGDPDLGSRVLPYHLKSEYRFPADRDFQELANEVVKKGVREVAGNLYADDTYYVYRPYGVNWAIGDLQWDYGAPITALAFNDNSISVEITPSAVAGEKAEILLQPADHFYKIDDDVETTSSGIPANVEMNRLPGSSELDVWGHIPVRSDGVDDRIAIQNPPLYIGDMFRKLLEERGVKVDGRVVVRELTQTEAAEGMTGRRPDNRVVLAEHDSLPLSQDIKLTLKVSQNLHAEMLLRTMAHVLDNVGSLQNGLKILNGFARRVGIPADEVQFAGGSGLSRDALVTPDALARLLVFMSRAPYFQPFYNALPVAGIDGTLSGRFHGTPLQGRVHAKTGSMDHVNALSGYMNLPGQRRIAFVIIGNHQPLDWTQATAVVDRIAIQIYRQYANKS